MGSKSDLWEIEVLKFTTGQNTTTPLSTTGLTNVYIGLFVTTQSTDAGPGTEVTGGSYARVQSKGSWATPTSGNPSSVTTNAVITFPTATAAWGDIIGFAIFSALSGGTMLMWGALTATKTVGNGDTASFAAGALTLTED